MFYKCCSFFLIVKRAFLISNCNTANHRINYIKELTKHIEFHSYGKKKKIYLKTKIKIKLFFKQKQTKKKKKIIGKCLHNKDIPEELKARNKFVYKLKKYFWMA